MAGKFTGVAPGGTGLYFEQNGFHRVDGGSNKILPSWSVLLPWVQVGFIVSTAEAAKSCFRGEFAAFDSGGFHRVFGRGSKILLPRRDCCLWSWRASSGLRQKQQNPVSMVCSAAFGPDGFHRVDGGSSKNLHPKACLLPLVQMGFIVSTAEATENLLLRRYGCL